MLILHLSRSSNRRSIWRYDGSDFNSIASRHRLRHYFSNACVSTDFWEILLRAPLRARDDRASVERCQDWKSRTHHPCSIRSVNRPQSISLSILLIVFWWIWRTKVTSRCPVIISSARRATRNYSICDQIPNWHVSVNACQRTRYRRWLERIWPRILKLIIRGVLLFNWHVTFVKYRDIHVLSARIIFVILNDIDRQWSDSRNSLWSSL